MTRELPDYLRPVPGPGDAGSADAATASDREPEVSGTPGLIPPMRHGRSGSFLTDVVVDLGYATSEQVEHAIAQSRTAGRSPEQILLEGGVIDAEQLSRATAERYGLNFVDLTVFGVDMGAANLISVKSARRHQTVPIAYVDEETLLLAMADPANILALDDVQMATGRNCRVAVAPAHDIEALVSKLGTLQSAVTEAIGEEEERGGTRGRAHQPAGVGRGRAGDQAGQQHPRAGGRGGGLGHPLRAEQRRYADQVPGRRRAPGDGQDPQADGLRRDLASKDHERP